MNDKTDSIGNKLGVGKSTSNKVIAKHLKNNKIKNLEIDLDTVKNLKSK